MTIHNSIEGILRLTRPLHCASPDKSLARSDNDNETPTMQMRVVTRNSVQTVPYFPGNDLRGRLRRKAAKNVMDRLSTKGKVAVDTYLGLCAGAISASPDPSALTVEEVLRARDNVYMGLFGGGARLLRSRYSVADLVPVIADTVDAGMVPAQYAEDGESTFMPSTRSDTGPKAMSGFQLVQTTHILRVDDVIRVLRPDELERYVGDPAAVAAYQSVVVDARNTRKSDKEKAKAGEIKKSDVSKKVGIENIATYQSIIPGTPMYFRLDFTDDVSDAHVGLMLLSLQELVREQALGGWVRAGLGQFDANLELTRNGEKMRIFTDVAANRDATLSTAMHQFVDAANVALNQLTEADLSAFFKARGDDTEEAC